MKFSVIGSQAAALAIIRQIHDSQQHDLGPCCLSGALADQAAAARIPLELEAEPENAMLASHVSAVVLALDDCERILQLTRAASQSDRHVIVIIPDTASTAFSFELHLLLDESSCSIIPVIGRFHLTDLPVEQHQLERFSGLPASSLLQVTMDCRVGPQSNAQLKPATLRMLDIAGALGLQYSQLTAIEAIAPDGTLISRLLTLGSSAASEQKLPPATITFHGEHQRTHDPLLSQGCTVQLTTLDGDHHAVTVTNDPLLLPRIAWLCEDRQRCVPWMAAFSTTMELSDAVEKSLRRRRTVDVYFDSGSERGVFKSQMTALGCGVLTWTLLGMIAFLWTAQITDLPPAALHIARALWILPVVIFLGAQLLLPLTRDRSTRKAQ